MKIQLATQPHGPQAERGSVSLGAFSTEQPQPQQAQPGSPLPGHGTGQATRHHHGPCGSPLSPAELVVLVAPAVPGRSLLVLLVLVNPPAAGFLRVPPRFSQDTRAPCSTSRGSNPMGQSPCEPHVTFPIISWGSVHRQVPR